MSAGLQEPDLRGKRVLVTGARGFLGRYAVEALRGAGAKVAGLGNGAIPDRELLRGMDARAVWEASLRDIDIVLHLAANTDLAAAESDPAMDFASNTAPVRDLLGACRACGFRPALILASTLRAAPGAEGVYHRHKRFAEDFLLDRVESGNGQAAVLRFSSLYGPPCGGGRTRGALNAMIAAALRGEPVRLYRGGRRDHLHAADAAAALVTAVGAMESCSGRAFDIGSGRSVAMTDAARLIAAQVMRRLGRAVRIVPMESGTGLPGENHDVVADGAAFRSATGWLSRWRLEDGIAQTVAGLAAARETAAQ